MKILEVAVTKVQALTEKLLNLRASKDQRAAEFAKKALDFSGKKELDALDKEIESTQRELEETQRLISQKELKAIEDKAVALSEHIRVNEAENSKLREEGMALRLLYEKTIPVKRIQISSKNWVKMTKEVETCESVVFSQRGEVLPEVKKKTLTNVFNATPDVIERALGNGWALAPGEVMPEPEALTPENSRQVETLTVPPVFNEFFERQVQMIPIAFKVS
jgi:hypothetical protein